MSFKVAIIGAGSVGFTKTLISDLLKVPEFESVEFALTDINAHNLDMIRQIIEKIVAVNNLPAKVTATTDRREALAGVVCRPQITYWPEFAHVAPFASAEADDDVCDKCGRRAPYVIAGSERRSCRDHAQPGTPAELEAQGNLPGEPVLNEGTGSRLVRAELAFRFRR
ncbi:MAG: hypothetical protein HY371_02205, partial [Devosia nanyangense]|nr:hypothetical protein [Devosia nanyangense]